MKIENGALVLEGETIITSDFAENEELVEVILPKGVLKIGLHKP